MEKTPGDIIILHMCTPPNKPKNQNFEKMEKNPVDIIILHVFAKNYDQMM